MKRLTGAILWVCMVCLMLLYGCAGGPALSSEPASNPPLSSNKPDTDYARSRGILTVDGLVATPLDLGYKDVTLYPAVTVAAVLYCPGVYENQPVREWYGVPIVTLVNAAGLKPEASRLVFYAADGYKTTISLDKIKETDSILAYKVDGIALPQADGYPFRLVAADLIGDAWVRWVTRIEVA